METLVGKQAPHFTMDAVTGNGQDFTKVSLDQYKGKWVVMFFYPLDFTFVCPTEITGMSRRIDEFKRLNAEILAVSVDSQYSHKAWIQTPVEKGGLGEINYPLGADLTKDVARNYGVLEESKGITLRGLFIIDPEGIVRYSTIHEAGVGRSADETLRVLQALQTGGLCPMDWHPGDKTL